MSKLLKRTLALALIFCLVLSVIPAVSAADSAETEIVTYRFSGSSLPKKLNAEGTAPGYTVAADGSYWYFLAGSMTPTISSTRLGFQPTNSANWITLVINVPEDGTYDLIVDHYTHFEASLGRVAIIPGTDANKLAFENIAASKHPTTGASGYNKYTTSIPYAEKIYHAIVDYAIGRGIGYNCAAMLGNVELTAGEYIVLLNGSGAKRYSYFYQNLNALKLVKSNDPAAAINYALKDAATGGDNWVSLASDLDLGTGVVNVAAGQSLNLNGHTLKAAGLKCEYEASVVDTVIQKNATTGAWEKVPSTGSINTTAGAPILTSYSKSFTLYDGSAYKLYTPTTAVTPGAAATKTNPYVTDEGYVRFGFDIALPDAAYAYVKDEKAPMEIYVTVQVADEDALRYDFDEIDDEWITSKSVNKAFFVDLKDVDKLEAGTEIKFTPYVKVLNVSIPCGTVTYTVPAA